jgi:hypothetical protein
MVGIFTGASWCTVAPDPPLMDHDLVNVVLPFEITDDKRCQNKKSEDGTTNTIFIPASLKIINRGNPAKIYRFLKM